MPKLDLEALPPSNKTGYPAPYADAVAGRWVRRLAPATGLTDFGASHVTLQPGAWSSQRHEDEMVIMLAGEAVLVDDAGRTPLRPGDLAVFRKNDGNGHHVINESEAPCTFVAIGRPPIGRCHYSDHDLQYVDGKYQRRDGTPL
jgi:uncharacterized cupin superfamily protein